MGYLLQKVRNAIRRQLMPPQKTTPHAAHEETELGRYILGSCESPEAEEYARGHLARLIRTLELTPPGSGKDRVLEIGAYMQITPALKYRLGYGEVRGCNLGPSGQIAHKSIQTADGDLFECDIDLFNAEREPFPYPDGHFDTILCGEVLEHLNEDPMYMMSEINRVTKPGGRLVLTTPNICAKRGIAALLTGSQPQHFSQYVRPGPDGTIDPKHSREYAPRELGDLLRDAGYLVDVLQTGPCGSRDPAEFDWVMPLLEQHGYSTELRDEGIYVVGSKNGPVQDRYPSWLYA